MTETVKENHAVPAAPSDAAVAGYICSERIAGTPLYCPEGDHIGTIDQLLIDPASGDIAFAVVRFGSLMGLGGQTESVPWSQLRFDIDVGGQVYDGVAAGTGAAPAVAGGSRRLRDAPAEQA